MANMVTIKKVLELPAILEASTLYMVKSASAGLFDIYLSDNTGAEARHVINRADIQSMINGALGGFNTVSIVADIAARNALASTLAIQVMVLNATGDPTVKAGAATYVYDPDTTMWYKISEFESLDLSLDWDKLIGKPVSSVTDIDDAVTRKHSHVNAALLDKIGESADGKLTYNGAPIRAFLDEEAW